MAEREGFEPSVPRERDNGFRDRPVRPLRHLSDKRRQPLSIPVPGVKPANSHLVGNPACRLKSSLAFSARPRSHLTVSSSAPGRGEVPCHEQARFGFYRGSGVGTRLSRTGPRWKQYDGTAAVVFCPTRAAAGWSYRSFGANTGLSCNRISLRRLDETENLARRASGSA
jgi:hypothetical protein